jgi:hypothetical protein
MRRLHLFEFNDSPWVPAWLREYETEYLHTVLLLAKPFDGLAPRLAALVRASGGREILDLCSGGGGPLPTLLERLARDHGLECRALLSDLLPNRTAQERWTHADGPIRYLDEPVDATAVPAHLGGVRTIFDALHHFHPAEAKRILADARRAGVPIGAFDIASRDLPHVLGSVLIPILVLAVTPLIRPFSWRRLALTYLVPVLPLLIWWDGLVSNLRAHRADELRELTREIAGPDYAFEAGTTGSGPSLVTWVLGAPVAPAVGRSGAEIR